MSIRDTQFQGFAKALLREIHDPIADYSREDCQEVIARRAYDLVEHVVDSLDSYAYDVAISDDELIKSIPDLTELPKGAR